jgi:hypothetical protein
VAPRVSTTMQVIQTDGFASGSNPITKVKGAQTIMSQSFCAFNTKEERTLLARGEETTTPQVVRASNFHVSIIHVHTHNFPLISLWHANFKCMKWHKSL